MHGGDAGDVKRVPSVEGLRCRLDSLNCHGSLSDDRCFICLSHMSMWRTHEKAAPRVVPVRISSSSVLRTLVRMR
ncbi:hypothetical protein PSDT_0597 [Parascardovia denticolens DSM 10105 = JCM 12538]|nr:hypothetical protein PSDT_0597 [Parascardovia denticolens DSM 10105 = JCM 12538]